MNIKLFRKGLGRENYQLNWFEYAYENLRNSPSVEEIISVTLNCVLIRMTEINPIDRSVLYQEFKEWIIDSRENNKNQEILCLRYIKNNN